MSIAVSVITLFALFLANIPIAVSMIASVLVYFLLAQSIEPMVLVQRLIGGIESIPLLAVPFFIVAGAMMNYTGITQRLAKFAELITGRLPGGLAQVNVVLATLMGGLSGSNIADAAMQTKILYPEMVKRNYSPGFAAAVIASAAQITPLIPPGIGMILYGYIGNVSIGKLFMAGVMPGLLTCVFLMVAIHFIAKKKGYAPIRTGPMPKGQLFRASKDAILALLLPVAIIGGIRVGMFTPSEAGAVAVVYALFLGVIFYREMKWRDFTLAIRESVSTTASVLLIIAAGSAFGWILTWERIPQAATGFITGFVDSPFLFLIVVNVFLLILGMFVEGNVAIIILTPLLIPMAQAYGIDPVHFGMVFLFNLSIGTLTPPLGTVMFTTCSIAKVKLEEFLKGMLPFYVVLLLLLLIITYVPAVSLWLPNLLM
ncbi:TRAP transporter large permease [Brevibacillus sp. B_LB10_24]|uniref:TRAP transporter large permease n=1 Tax=Brevibacillus sp. B_LB10_24 TaxID=3380645 RepID=UPI0038BD1033